MGGLGGREKPLAPAATEWRPQAVPVATKEATGIDSRDEGFPFPQALERFNFEKGETRGGGTAPPGSVVLRPSGQMMLAHLAPESIQAEIQRRGNLLAASAETAQAFAQNGGLHALQSFPQRALRGHARFR